MKVTGIIAEYNPFHNGHAHQLTEVRRRTGADFLIVAMGGDFLQRGGPAIVDKHTRARMALCAGADLVLELPVPCAVGSAEYFADGGVCLLAATAVVTNICYGMETPNAALLTAAAALLAAPPASFEQRISDLVKTGSSYPKARETALLEALSQFPADELRAFLAQPNNILALEYEKAILRHSQTGGPTLVGLGIPRVGDGYHSSEMQSEYASATAIRQKLFSMTAETAFDTSLSALSPFLPKHSLALLAAAAENRLLLNSDDFSEALYMRLFSCRDSGYSEFADCTEAISNRIREHLNEYLSFSQFADLVKTRDVTLTRINRVLTHILLDIRQEDYHVQSPAYLRVLGFTRRAEALLSEIDKKASVPLVTRVTDAFHALSEPAAKLLLRDINAAELYRGISHIKSGQVLSGEYDTAIIIP